MAKKKVQKKSTKKSAAQKKTVKKSAAKKAVRKPVRKTTGKVSPKKQASVKVVVAPGASVPKAPAIGENVPDFSIPSTAGQDFVLSQQKGKKVILYFYPKDSTPGCTIEAFEFSGLLDQFENQNTKVFGISRNSLLSHDKFRQEQNLKIDLLSDPDEKACKLFDVIKMKNMYGNMSMGIERSTFLLDEEGRLVKEWRKVKAEGHAKEVLATVQNLNKN